jgi:hypothetical protein
MNSYTNYNLNYKCKLKIDLVKLNKQTCSEDINRGPNDKLAVSVELLIFA